MPYHKDSMVNKVYYEVQLFLYQAQNLPFFLF